MSIKPDSLCRLLIHRSSGRLISEVDRQEIMSKREVAPSEQIDSILEKLKTRSGYDNDQDTTATNTGKNASLFLLDCLRSTPFHIPNLPVINTILWITPSADYAAYLIQTLNSSPDIQEPFFWPVEISSLSPTHSFLYRVCNVFTSFKSKLILVFPQGPTSEDMRHAIQGALKQWTNISLVVYSGLASVYDHRYGSVIYKTASCTPELVEFLNEDGRSLSWAVNDFTELQRETDLYNQMMWLAKLMFEDSKGEESEWLRKVGWTGTMDGHQKEEILTRNLKDWKSNELCRYVLKTRLWSCDPDGLAGVAPVELIQEMISGDVVRPLPNMIYSSCDDVTKFGVDEATKYDPIAGVVLSEVAKLLPTLVTSGVMPVDVMTPTFRRLAIEKCCKFAIQCLIFSLKL